MPRKVPFSGAKKKEQLKAKRIEKAEKAAKLDELEKAGEDASYDEAQGAAQGKAAAPKPGLTEVPIHPQHHHVHVGGQAVNFCRAHIPGKAGGAGPSWPCTHSPRFANR